MLFNYFQIYHHPTIHSQLIGGLFGVSTDLLGVIATLISTLFLGALALFGDQIRAYLFKPNLQPVEPVRTSQSIGSDKYIYYRLIVKNVGRFVVVAREVRVLLTYTEPLINFIPIPLAWTHFNANSSRDIPRGEPAYVDILRKKEGEQIYHFCWSPGTGSDDPVLNDFDQSKNIRLEFFERNRKIGDIYLRYIKNLDVLEVVTK